MGSEHLAKKTHSAHPVPTRVPVEIPLPETYRSGKISAGVDLAQFWLPTPGVLTGNLHGASRAQRSQVGSPESLMPRAASVGPAVHPPRVQARTPISLVHRMANIDRAAHPPRVQARTTIGLANRADKSTQSDAATSALRPANLIIVGTSRSVFTSVDSGFIRRMEEVAPVPELSSDEELDPPFLELLFRVWRKGFSGTAIGDIANGLSVVPAAAASLVSMQAVGVAGGATVFLGGLCQLFRAGLLSEKDLSDRLYEAGKGALNILSGAMGVTAGALTLAGFSSAGPAVQVTALISITTWLESELVNVVQQLRGAVDDFKGGTGWEKCTGRVLSVLGSLLKILGAVAFLFSSNLPSVVAGYIGLGLGGTGAAIGIIAGAAHIIQLISKQVVEVRTIREHAENDSLGKESEVVDDSVEESLANAVKSAEESDSSEINEFL